MKIAILFVLVYGKSTRASFEAFFWEVKPYIFTNSNGTLDGIIPTVLDKGGKHCYHDFVKHSNRIETRRKFTFLKRTNSSLDSDKNKATIWYPSLDKEFIKDSSQFEIVSKIDLAVFIQRYRIALMYKIMNAMRESVQILIVFGLLACSFAILIWLAESSSNLEFPSGLFKGLIFGLWWSVTFGYGDVSPKSTLGKLISFLWVCCIVFFTAIITAEMVESLTGMSDFKLEDERVAVLENSYEFDYISRHVKNKLVSASSYENVFEKVRSGEATAGVMDENVAAWHLDEINGDDTDTPMRIVEIIPANLFVDAQLIYKPYKHKEAN